MSARGSDGGRVMTGVEWVGEVDGSTVREWDTTAVEGGRIKGNTLRGAERVHVVRDDVMVVEEAVEWWLEDEMVESLIGVE